MTQITKSEAAVLERIEQQPMLDRTMTWAKINSGTANLEGLAAMAQQLGDAFAELPGEVELVAPDPVETMQPDGAIQTLERGKHLVATVRPDAPVQLLFTGHMDTVFPKDSGFQELSWREDNILNGPGVADMKGGIAVMLHALMALEGSDAKDRIGYQVMINSDEEVGSGSSAALIKRLAQGKTAALTYEPALPDGTLAGARGGSGNYSIKIGGRSAHAGRNPEDGRNAVVAAADLALRLKALMRDGLSVNPAKIDGGGANNVVPDHAILRVNFRPRDPRDQAEAEEALERACAAIAMEHDVSVHPHGGFGRPPKPLSEGAEKLFGLVKRSGADLGLDIGWRTTGGVCDGNNIADCGIPVVDTMGVRGDAIHSADEILIVDSLAERARLSALTILRLAEKGLA
ncbi:hydrolase [Novosphingopyxis sp. YJ-S2-01]|uniref:hydrolase n=1 Tax=Novosphingopyxis sp. YJ-S2-01 TaxID=2794021 RepID=UPI0018DD28DF|nr:hydrolase [Novosphingopyxis sp. YJ-S2-01]MBH9537277.1 hydrolase [Novosphingopyxis sp. YJ-S2-01]